MEQIEWTDEFTLGIEAIDKQHMILVRAINLLSLGVARNCDEELLGDIFDTLADYTAVHFTYEESLFEGGDYPDVEAHKRSHEALLARLNELKAKWQAGEAEIGGEVLAFLIDWLRNHILGSDKDYAPFVTGETVEIKAAS